jgi:hypothetical protein
MQNIVDFVLNHKIFVTGICVTGFFLVQRFLKATELKPKESSAEMVQRTWNTLKNAGTINEVTALERFADTFYGHLFEKNPGSENLNQHHRISKNNFQKCHFHQSSRKKTDKYFGCCCQECN